MNDSDHRDEIVRLEAQIDELAASVESCHSPRAAHPQSSAAAKLCGTPKPDRATTRPIWRVMTARYCASPHIDPRVRGAALCWSRPAGIEV